MINRKHIQDKKVVDLECGLGAGPQVFAHLGAARAFGVDYYLNPLTPSLYPQSSSIEYLKLDFTTDSPFREEIDFIYLNNASEHIKSVSEYMRVCFEALLPSGTLFIAHDNYYQPVGHHDHKFLFLNDEGNAVATVAPKCWEMEEKCERSSDYRLDLKQVTPPIWSNDIEAYLSPENCGLCPYYKRSQPWAHLFYQNEFNTLFPFSTFRTVDQGYLNKVTIPQIRQFAIEAGFLIDYEERYWLANEPEPPLSHIYSRQDLTTFQYFLRLRKPQRSD